MKAIQFTIDEKLLAELDACKEAQADGRSAVLRRALTEYLRRMRRKAIAGQYAQAYALKPSLGKEFDGWEDQGQWPEE